MSGTRRFWFGNVSADSTQFGVMSDLIRSWIGLESVSSRPTYARYTTDLRPTNHLPSVAELRPTRPRTLPDKTDTIPTYNRQTTDNLSGRDLSNMFERSLPDKFVCPNININRHQTDKTHKHKPTSNRQNRINTDCKPISPRIWWFLSVWGRFRVGLGGVTGVLATDCHRRYKCQRTTYEKCKCRQATCMFQWHGYWERSYKTDI